MHAVRRSRRAPSADGSSFRPIRNQLHENGAQRVNEWTRVAGSEPVRVLLTPTGAHALIGDCAADLHDVNVSDATIVAFEEWSTARRDGERQPFIEETGAMACRDFAREIGRRYTVLYRPDGLAVTHPYLGAFARSDASATNAVAADTIARMTSTSTGYGSFWTGLPLTPQALAELWPLVSSLFRWRSQRPSSERMQ